MRARILIVEDEAVIAADLGISLERKGYEVVDFVSRGEDALKAIESLRPDLVFMDITLDGAKDGIETARYINEHYGLPIIYLTAHADKATIRRATLTMPYGYLLKPFNEDAISIAIEMAMSRHALELKIARSEQKYRALFERMVTAYALHELVFDEVGTVTGYRIEEGNPMFWGILGRAGVDVANYIEGLFSDNGIDWNGLIFEVGLREETKHLELYSAPLDCWYSATFFSPGVGEFSLILADITDLKRSDEKLRKTNEELRNLAEHLETVREKERTAIAREIHDYMGQSLTAMRIDLSWILKRIGEGQEDLAEKARTMLELIDGAIQNVRSLCAELRPGVLDDLGLVAALEWQINEFAGRTGLVFTNDIPGDDLKIGEKLAVIHFRVFQELMANIIRHASATEVRVFLGVRDGDLVLEVRDNGKGIDEGSLDSPLSFGILGMRERARSCGGRLEFISEAVGGTTVRLSTPLEENS